MAEILECLSVRRPLNSKKAKHKKKLSKFTCKNKSVLLGDFAKKKYMLTLFILI
jgi:hypothetical protein